MRYLRTLHEHTTRNVAARGGWLLALAVAPMSAIFARPLSAVEKPTSIWVMNADGSDARHLVQLEGYTYHRMPRWSHDGKQIAFYAANKKGYAHEVFIANADGSKPRQLAVGDCPDWSPGSKQLLFDTWGPGFATEVLNVDGSGRRRLCLGSAPRWSPDGTQIVVLVDNMPIVVEVDNGKGLALFNAALADAGEAVAWSPDGKSLALFAQMIKNNARQLFIISAEGAAAGQRALRVFGGSVLNYSPDGKQLIFDVGGFIQVVDVEGKAAARMLPGQKGRNQDAHFSPDGKLIVFASNREE